MPSPQDAQRLERAVYSARAAYRNAEQGDARELGARLRAERSAADRARRPDDSRPRMSPPRGHGSRKQAAAGEERDTACHEARANDADPAAQAAARTIGQCAATIHSARHCIGLALYGALAVAYDDLGTKAPWAQLEQRAAEECGRMLAALRAVAVEDEPNPAKINWNC